MKQVQPFLMWADKIGVCKSDGEKGKLEKKKKKGDTAEGAKVHVSKLI